MIFASYHSRPQCLRVRRKALGRDCPSRSLTLDANAYYACVNFWRENYRLPRGGLAGHWRGKIVYTCSRFLAYSALALFCSSLKYNEHAVKSKKETLFDYVRKR